MAGIPQDPPIFGKTDEYPCRSRQHARMATAFQQV